MNNFCYALIGVAAILDIAANLLLEKSDGFKKMKYGITALFCVCIAFTILAQVTKYIDLTIAYVSWGAMAIFGTAMSARFLFGHKINWIGWTGILLIVGSIFILKTA